jgi:hypothetical protein
MSLLAKAGAVLDAGALDVRTTTGLGREPSAVAFGRRRDRGAVMSLLRRPTDDWMTIIALWQRGDASWDEVALVHKLWWDPVEAFVGEHDQIGQPVTLTARRGEAESTAVFEPFDYP